MTTEVVTILSRLRDSVGRGEDESSNDASGGWCETGKAVFLNRLGESRRDRTLSIGRMYRGDGSGGERWA